MHVAMIMDEERLLHEHPMLNRLSVGLIDAGVTLTRIVPDIVQAETIFAGERRVALAHRLPAPFRVLPWMRRTRAQRLANALEKSPPDVIYAIGEQTWSLATDLGAIIERPAAINIWAARQLHRLPHGKAASQIGGYIAATTTLAAALRKRVDPEFVTHVPIGVAIPRRPKSVLERAEDAIGVAIVGSGRDAPAYEAMLSGISRVLHRLPQTQVVLELRGPRAHEIWRMARRLDLLGSISTVQDAAQIRSLLTGCDVLVVPERNGEVSSILLECMASAMPVVTAADPYLEMLIDDETAVLVRENSSEEWAGDLLRALTDPEYARRLGMGARGLVEHAYRSSLQIDGLLDTFDRLMTGGNYQFERSPAAGGV